MQRVRRLLDAIVTSKECMDNPDDARLLYSHDRLNLSTHKSFKEFQEFLGQLHEPVYTDFFRFYFGNRPLTPHPETISGALSHYGCRYTSKKKGSISTVFQIYGIIRIYLLLIFIYIRPLAWLH